MKQPRLVHVCLQHGILVSGESSKACLNSRHARENERLRLTGGARRERGSFGFEVSVVMDWTDKYHLRETLMTAKMELEIECGESGVVRDKMVRMSEKGIGKVVYINAINGFHVIRVYRGISNPHVHVEWR